MRSLGPLPGSSSLPSTVCYQPLLWFLLFRGLLFHFLTYLLDLTQVSISYCRSCSVLYWFTEIVNFLFIACLSLDLGERRDANIPVLSSRCSQLPSHWLCSSFMGLSQNLLPVLLDFANFAGSR